MKKRGRLSPTDEGIEKEFLKHCEEGWSTQSFAGKLIGTNVSFHEMLKKNPKCREINDKFRKSFKKGYQ